MEVSLLHFNRTSLTTFLFDPGRSPGVYQRARVALSLTSSLRERQLVLVGRLIRSVPQFNLNAVVAPALPRCLSSAVPRTSTLNCRDCFWSIAIHPNQAAR